MRVHGVAHIEANATVGARGTELSGKLVDDSGRAIPDGHVRVRWHTDTGPRPLPRPVACGGAPAHGGVPSEAGDEALAGSDQNGHFCLRWPVELPSGHLALEFEDERKLLDATSSVVELDRRPALELSFVPAPRLLSADDPQVTVVLQARVNEAQSEPATVTLDFARVGGEPTPLAQGALRTEEALRLSFDPKRLSAAGPGELRARANFGARHVQAQAPVSVTAKVVLDVPVAIEANADGEAWLEARVHSVFGPVPTGSVEAIVAGRTAGIAPVVGGAARVPLRLPAQAGQSTITVRYLSAAPWWIPAGGEEVAVTVLRGAPWKWLPWGAGLAAVATWVLLAWRRPQRKELRSAVVAAPKPIRPEIEWLSSSAGRALGWSGRVLDAHDGHGIEGASVRIAWPHGVVLEGYANQEGVFEIPFEGAVAHGGVIGVESPWHARLERPLPPPGNLTVSLVTRRRALLARLAEWAEQRRPRLGPADPTPAELARAAGARHPEVAVWASAVESAAFGPTPVDAEREAEVEAQKPSS